MPIETLVELLRQMDNGDDFITHAQLRALYNAYDAGVAEKSRPNKNK